MGEAVTAILDANVLYPAPLRDLLMRLALAGLFRARWTEAIHDEWVRSVLANNPSLAPERLARTRALMNEAIRDCLVTEYEGTIGSLSLPDPKDWHVLAAAIHAGAEVIVTFNLQDFPDNVLTVHGIEALHPDDFVTTLFDDAPEDFCAAVRKQRESLRNPPRSAPELLATFENQGLSQLVSRLATFVDQL
jgi:predicted nucleic acid-binding protein